MLEERLACLSLNLWDGFVTGIQVITVKQPQGRDTQQSQKLCLARFGHPGGNVSNRTHLSSTHCITRFVSILSKFRKLHSNCSLLHVLQFGGGGEMVRGERSCWRHRAPPPVLASNVISTKGNWNLPTVGCGVAEFEDGKLRKACILVSHCLYVSIVYRKGF